MSYLLKIMIILPLFMVNCMSLNVNLVEEAAIRVPCLHLCEDLGMELYVLDKETMHFGYICKER